MRKWIENLPVSAKVASAPVLVLLCLIAVMSQSYFGNLRSTATLDGLVDASLPRIATAGELAQRATRLNGMVMQSLAYEGAGLKPDIIEALDKRIAAEFKGLHESIAQAKQAMFTGSLQSLGRMDAADVAFKKFERAALDTLDVKSAGLATASSMMSTAESSFAELERHLSALSQAEMASGKQSGVDVRAMLQRVNAVTLGLSLTALLLCVAITIFCTRLIVCPLGKAVGLAREVASGNLRAQDQATSTDATGQVLSAIADVACRLNSIVSGIRASALEIQTASGEIAGGNGDLSLRTESTAAALQMTASSLQQISSTVHSTAHHAASAKTQAGDASRVAEQGGEVMRKVTEAMAAIHSDARRIREIIATIDGIAFQTNILALNAAVEAARAGEQGRGFAVVASEVRALAQRSAEAAKEIRTLITASVDRVGEGMAHVESAGDTMIRVVASIARVDDTVGSIAQATTSQANEIQEIHRAVTEMDRSTQQNAALVEEASAAAESLRQQARMLVEAVATFTVA